MSRKRRNPEHSALRHFDDFDRFADATRGWDLDFRQLDRGPLSAEIFQVCSRESVLMRVRFSRALDQRGCSPHGFFTFGLLDYGVSGVRAYLKAVRLDEARRALRSGSCASVADAANHCGFWHMGKFAADYRSQFAELPSDTRRHSAR